MHMILRSILYSLLLAIPIAAEAQSTIVSATVVDQTSVVWANGNYTLQFVPNPQAQGNPTWNGNPFPNTQWTYSGVLDNAGHFSTSVPSNTFISPAGSTYTATICANTSAACTVIPRLTFQGTSMDISATITANAVITPIQAQFIPRAYNDSEMAVQNSQAGYFYQNVTSNHPRYWNGTAWSDFGGTINSITLNNFSPLFNVTQGGTANDPTYSFTAQSVSGNTVYGRCVNTGGTPSFCSLTATMIGLAGTLSNNISGNAGTATASDHSPVGCTGNNWTKSLDTGWNSNCTQPGFTNLSGNIAVTQMNNGTNADSSHFWAGDGTWKPVPVVPTTIVKGETITTGICAPGSSTSFDYCTFNYNFVSGAFPTALDSATVNCLSAPLSGVPSTAGSSICNVVGGNASGVTIQIQNARSITSNVTNIYLTAVGH